ncbi:hypothetical protein B296_00014928 [Ensete ventricosum]|uniref:Uncharacterized protein n=1 Tax=Ensete ventricosum TaxID=4639 RepID=A0A427AJH1_ENSVE|nr:hypothetical protein B296_00014928 [Ensete ventricosum]
MVLDWTERPPDLDQVGNWCMCLGSITDSYNKALSGGVSDVAPPKIKLGVGLKVCDPLLRRGAGAFILHNKGRSYLRHLMPMLLTMLPYASMSSIVLCRVADLQWSPTDLAAGTELGEQDSSGALLVELALELDWPSRGNSGTNLGDLAERMNSGTNIGDLVETVNSGTNLGDLAEGVNSGINLGDLAERVNSGTNLGDLTEKMNSSTNFGYLAERVNSGTNLGDLAERVNSGTNLGDLAERVNSSTNI